MKEKYSIENLVGVFTVDKGDIKILLVKKKTEPYKGYWMLPNDVLKKSESLENNVTNIVYDQLGFQNLYMEQCHTFCDSEQSNMKVAYLAMIDNITLTYKKEERENVEIAWFEIDSIPKLILEHEEALNKLNETFKIKLLNSNILKKLFPSDFTLPELQKIYENILGKTIDRRNFRKKLINLKYIVDTNETYLAPTGRPAKLYRFEEKIMERNLF